MIRPDPAVDHRSRAGEAGAGTAATTPCRTSSCRTSSGPTAMRTASARLPSASRPRWVCSGTSVSRYRRASAYTRTCRCLLAARACGRGGRSTNSGGITACGRTGTSGRRSWTCTRGTGITGAPSRCWTSSSTNPAPSTRSAGRRTRTTGGWDRPSSCRRFRRTHLSIRRATSSCRDRTSIRRSSPMRPTGRGRGGRRCAYTAWHPT